MKGKITFCILFSVLFSGQVQAQPGSFVVKITQVYPSGDVVYGNNYNLSGELDKAVQKLRSQYNGKNANYVMELTRPSGKETKYIQNIYWILTENGKKTNLKNRPALKEYYHESTVVEYYACDIYGRQKSGSAKEKVEYDYYYCFHKGDIRFCRGNDTVYTLAGCRKKMGDYFTANSVNTLLCAAKIHNSKGIAVDSIDNGKEYELYRKHIADSVQQAVKTAELTKQKDPDGPVKKVMAEPVYNSQQTEQELNRLLAKTDSLKDGQQNFRKNVDAIIDEADKIVRIMEQDADSMTFDRNRYFETADLKQIKAGLKKLLDINQKKAEHSNRKDIDIRLKNLQSKAGDLKKGSENYRQEMSVIINEADKIIEDMKIDSKKFNRNKYFEGELEDLKKGIEKLIAINSKRK
ncbi:MAG: hypothetical protein LBQ01_02850 [Prevotellaceae bacterium]|jgi:hypothetical protein|nr:hypothetical protein [Prevotellaceae bacterium]